MRYPLFAIATAMLLLGGCGLRPLKPSVTDRLAQMNALYGEAVVVYPKGSNESRSRCAKADELREDQKRACSLLVVSDEVPVNVSSSFWGGVFKWGLLIPSDQKVQEGDIVKFHTREGVFGFIKVAARAGDPSCRWESGMIKGTTAQGVVCEDYDYRTVIEILSKYQ